MPVLGAKAWTRHSETSTRVSDALYLRVSHANQPSVIYEILLLLKLVSFLFSIADEGWIGC